MWRGESPAPSGKGKGEGIVRAWSLSRLDLGTAKGLDTKAPKSQRPSLSLPGLERRSQSLMTPMRSGGG